MRKMNLPRELWITYLAILTTLVVTCLGISSLTDLLWLRLLEGHLREAVEQGVFTALVLFLIYGSFVYQLARVGYLRKLAAHWPATREALQASFYGRTAPAVTILVPSYKEEARTVEQTLLSAALQEYPNRRVVLLLDDPPDPKSPEDEEKRVAARRVAGEVQGFVDVLASRLAAEHSGFSLRQREPLDLRQETKRMAELYEFVAEKLEHKAHSYSRTDHTDRFFARRVLLAPARAHLKRARSLRARKAGLSEAQLLRDYERLVALFRVDVGIFERKRYLNLSHEPNKAMNLNSYIGLIGRRFVEVEGSGGRHLEPSAQGEGEAVLEVPEARYVVTLDADSLLMPGYVLRLVHHMERPGNESVAVAQSPYTSIPGAPGVLERIAGATTDIQYIVHQGSSYFKAGYWVGANAVLRKEALDDIGMVSEERGFKVAKYIQDRTVIEDTESTIDLIERGWEIYNYPARLAYSATPPDFGALLIQRHRWANGGLIILPKLLHYIFKTGERRLVEGFLRVHYLISLAGVNAALLLLFIYPFDENLLNVWLPLAAAPYFFLYGRDLALIGYRFRDVLIVYAFNLMLVPIQLGGALKSLYQAWTGKKSPFGRTPKVKGRTGAPKRYVAAELGLLVYLSFGSAMDAVQANWTSAALSLFTAAFFFYSVSALIGWKNSAEDLGLRSAPTEG